MKGEDWADASLFAALVFGALAAFVGLATTSEPLVGSAVFFLVFAVVFAVCFNYPRLAAAKRAEEIERDFAIALRSIAIQLASGASFESVLKRESKSNAREPQGGSLFRFHGAYRAPSFSRAASGKHNVARVKHNIKSAAA